MKRNFSIAMAVAAVAVLGGCQMMRGDSKDASPTTARNMMGVSLSGKNEVPPNDSSATGSAMVTLMADGAIKAHVTANGMEATAAHIHMAAAGANGPVVVPLEKQGSDFVSKADAKLTPEQVTAYRGGQMYVNVHSAKFPNGEIRAQLKGS